MNATDYPPDLVVVACGSQKAPGPMPARDLYQSTTFRLARAAAERLAPRHGWYVLSARHGLIHPDTVTHPYDQRITFPGAITAEQVRTQARDLGLLTAERCVLLGPHLYAQAARQAWPRLIAPAEGQPVGYMNQTYKDIRDGRLTLADIAARTRTYA
ncbi:DUF6884 domain-containing protein [Streptacidiphilus cavernicola]|uniref:DUF6884 domain-containing protein n=1 Tax=Streptacidiphilus cavernicola TaxID=3342716 RepID=A0ABV6VY16_9ACTN